MGELFSKSSLIRFAETFVAVFVSTFAVAPALTGGTIDLGSQQGLAAIVAAAVSAAVIASRRAFASLAAG